MRISNRLVIALAGCGAMNMTAAGLEAGQAYSVMRFRRGLKEAYNAIVDSEREIIRECGLSIGEGGRIEGSGEQLVRFGRMRDELREDCSEIEATPLPYGDWHLLVRENRGLAALEDELENILWT